MESLANSIPPRRSERDSEPLTYNTGKGHFHTVPFLRGCYDDFLPRDEYESLARSFPGPEYFILKQGKYGKTVFKSGSAFTDFVTATPTWQRLFDLFASNGFIEELRTALGAGIAKARPDISDKRWVIAQSPLESRGGDYPVRMSVEFSRLHQRDYLEPHTDNPNKIISLLYYFQDSDWKPQYGGGTDFYAPKFQRLNDNWENRYMNFGAMRRIWSPDFVGNRLAFFVKDRNSWHGISPLQCPGGVSRKALLINYETFSDKIHGATLKSKTKFFELRALYRLKETLTGGLSTPSQGKA